MVEAERVAAATRGHTGITRLASDPVLHLQALVVLAIALGGGGVAYGLRNLVIQLAALLILAVHAGRVRLFLHSAPRMLIALVGASVLLPALQLVPLPPSLWHALPGREPVAESLALLGSGSNAWRPLTLDAGRTIVALCGLLAPFAIVAVGATLDSAEKLALARAAVLAMLAAFLLGAVQLLSANTFGLLYPVRIDPDALYATFANRNSTALCFAIGVALIAGMGVPRRATGLWFAAAGAILLALGVVLTQSRSGMVVLAVVLLCLLGRAGLGAFTRSRATAGKTWIAAWIAGLLVLLALVASAMSGGRAAESIARYGDLQDDRFEMWDDASYAAGRYWPVGSGTGTFDEVFQLHESLEYVSPRRAGRAHSDWLEIAMEGGLPALVLALAWLGWSLWAALPRGSIEGRQMRFAAGLGALGIALQSLLDYPLRNQSLLCIAALLVVLLVRQREAAR